MCQVLCGKVGLLDCCVDLGGERVEGALKRGARRQVTRATRRQGRGRSKRLWVRVKNRATYQLRRLRLHRLIGRISNSLRYRPTDFGLRI